jgi:hypothetical protein
MIMTNEQIKQIVLAGGGLVIDASTMTFNQIKDISSAANTSKARITVKNIAELTALQLKELAALAPGLIVFDLTAQTNP